MNDSKRHGGRQERAHELLTKLRTSPEGEELYRMLLDYCHFSRSAFAPGDVNQTMYNLGRQSVGHFLYHAANAGK